MKLYQVYYDQESKNGLDRSFIPYDNTNPVRDKEFEYGVIRDIYYNDNPFKTDKYFGVLSWKFTNKTGLKGKEFISWINKNKGYDVYMINPFPEYSYIFYNNWYQGDYWHPGLIDLTLNLFKEAGIDNLDITKKRHDVNVCTFCNYFVGNQKFYKIYMEYCEKLYSAIYKADKETKRLLFDINVYGVGNNIAFFPFIYERMLSTIVSNFNFKSIMYDNLSTRTKDDFNRKFVLNSSNYIKRINNNFDNHSIEYLNSFGNMYCDMVMSKFTKYENYMCGGMFI